MHYLETGEPPVDTERTTGDQIIPPWPLPETGLKPEETVRRRSGFPDVKILIDIAIAERCPADVVRWYDHEGQKPSYGWMMADYKEDQIARAIAKKYPDRAIAIWKRIAEGLIDQTKVRAYQSASEYLLKIHMLLEKLDRKAEFKAYIEDLRQTHARKYRLVEILDRMTGRPIADGQ